MAVYWAGFSCSIAGFGGCYGVPVVGGSGMRVGSFGNWLLAASRRRWARFFRRFLCQFAGLVMGVVMGWAGGGSGAGELSSEGLGWKMVPLSWRNWMRAR